MRSAYAGNSGTGAAIAVEGIARFALRELRIVGGWIQYGRLDMAQQHAAAGDTGAASVAGVQVAPVPAPIPRPDLCPECQLPG